MGGQTALFAGTAIAYSAKWQITVATSSTKAEFVQAVLAAKMAKHLQNVLSKLGIQQCGSTIIYEDNAVAIMMANNSRPIRQTQHIDISYFALQEWVTYGNIKLAHICRIANPADALTKALGWTLHHHHATRIMGHLGTKYTNT
eukprot:15356507-Ditylum_brightwellii.AAC.1